MSIDRLLEMPANQYQVVDVIALRDAFHDKVETIVSLRADLAAANARTEVEAALKADANRQLSEAMRVLRSVMDTGPIRQALHGMSNGLGTNHSDGIAIKAAEAFLDSAPVPPAESKVADDVVRDAVRTAIVERGPICMTNQEADKMTAVAMEAIRGQSS